ncbi:hypothetical protein VIGAN_09120000 [Vigna angularis var. angularis]|uniref:Uncharacterized protein n=1 Tax=Vigna angularis var. angularis TaxID=157739 RepID=A0A0S3SYA3_PHAAN|nr:hypothetical protein VIGAN_09120000 [Vigna angularis var. angularis]
MARPEESSSRWCWKGNSCHIQLRKSLHTEQSSRGRSPRSNSNQQLQHVQLHHFSRIQHTFMLQLLWSFYSFIWQHSSNHREGEKVMASSWKQRPEEEV